MLFFKLRQIIEMKNLEFDEDGFLILFHKYYLNGHRLRNEIKKYHYFGYEVSEALHLSPNEEKTTWELYRKIANEYYNNQDEYSREIILANMATLLKYGQRAFSCQRSTCSQLHGGSTAYLSPLFK